MSKQKYLSLALSLPVEWLRDCAAKPSPHMRPIHLALVRIAVRRKERTA